MKEEHPKVMEKKGIFEKNHQGAMEKSQQGAIEKSQKERIESIESNRCKKKSAACRILLNEKSSGFLAQLIERLKEDSCKTDTSKVVNSILRIFFQKYEHLEREHLVHEFFDKKSYLKKIIQSVSDEELDNSIETYLGKVSHHQGHGKGKSKRRSKTNDGSNNNKDC